MNRLACATVAIGLSVIMSAAALADDKPKPPPTASDFADEHGNLTGEKLRAYLKWVRQYDVFNAIDSDRDGKLSAEELTSFEKKLDAGVEESLIDVEQRIQRLSGRPALDEAAQRLAEDQPLSISAAEADRFIPLKWPENRWKVPNLYVRKAYDAITLADPAKPWDKATGLTLSFERNERDDTEKLSIDGALIYVMTLAEPVQGEDCWIGRISMAPSVGVERLKDDLVAKTDRLTKDKNVLTARLMLEAECGAIGPFTTNYFRFTPGYATDSRFDADIGLLDLEWEPICGSAGIGTPHRFFGAVDLALRTRLVGAARRVSDGGFATTVADGETDFRWGPKLDLSIGIPAFPELGFTVGYAHLESLNGDPQDLDRTTLGFKYDLSQNVAFSIEYINGFKWVALSEEETMKLGLSIKF